MENKCDDISIKKERLSRSTINNNVIEELIRYNIERNTKDIRNTMFKKALNINLMRDKYV